MFSEVQQDCAIRVRDISKCFYIYDAPRDRLKQFFSPVMQRLLGASPKKYFREFWALENISIDVNKGETLGVVGRNGSGKSTLLQIICGTLTATGGSVEAAGRVAALLELGSGFNPEFTGTENIYMNAAILGLEKEEVDARFEEIVAFADIGEYIDQPVQAYSSGMVLRLAFSVAINVDADILVVDEALSVGDELFQRKCFSRLEKIRENGATILFVSHSGHAVIELCDRAVLIDSGELLAVGEPRMIVGAYQKLLYAPADQAGEVRRSIKEGSFSGRMSDERSGDNVESLSKRPLMDAHPACQPSAYLDSSLKVATTINYQSSGARIEFPEFRTLGGEKVNCLKKGDKYQYCYNVRFLSDSFDVRFGMLIKALNGIEMGGLGTASLGSGIECIPAGTVVKVCFGFHCTLLPGQYFTNAGCSGKINGEDAFLHRIVDAAVFRVLPGNDSEVRAGYIDFSYDTPCYSIDWESQ